MAVDSTSPEKHPDQLVAPSQGRQSATPAHPEHSQKSATRRVFGWAIRLAVVAYFLFCAVFLGLRYVVLPNIDLYKTEVEQLASRALGQPLAIGTIHASWHGLRPKLNLTDVVVRNRAGVPALQLPRVAATVSWRSLPALGLRLHALEIMRPDLEIERDAQGQIFLGGIYIDPDKKSDNSGLDWLLAQREIVIRDGWLRWRDTKRQAAPLVLEGVNAVLQNSWRRHRFSLQATPPQALAAPIDIRGDFTHARFARSLADYRLWKGELYADWQETDLAAWKAYVDYPVEVEQGRGAVRAWLRFNRTRIEDFTADLHLSNVRTRLGPELAWLDLAQVQGRVAAQEEVPRAAASTWTLGRAGHRLALKDFSWETADGQQLAPVTLTETFVAATKDQPERTTLEGTTLDLEAVARFAGHLPLPAAQRQMLADLAPRGHLKNFSAAWEGAYPDISSYRIESQFEQLSVRGQRPRPGRPKTKSAPAVAALPGMPGFANVTGSIKANEQGGALQVDSREALLQLPGYLSQSDLAFSKLALGANWSFPDNETLKLQLEKLVFEQEGAQGSLSGTHILPLAGNSPGVADYSGQLARFDLSQIERYLPSTTPASLRDWLATAIEAGEARDVSLRLKGNLADFPFQAKQGSQSKGEFRVAGKLAQGRLNYVPDETGRTPKLPLWPLLEEIDGTFDITGARLHVLVDSARTHNVKLSQVEASVSDLLAKDSQLQVKGQADGALQDLVRYVNDSPVGEWIGEFTADTKATGNARLALQLQMPFHDPEDTTVKGSVSFDNNTVTLMQELPQLEKARGTLHFHEDGFSLDNMRAGFLGGQMAVTGGTQSDGTTAVRAQGNLSVAGVRQHYAIPGVQRLLQHIQGGTNYDARIAIRQGRPEINVESSMQGIALDFPAPLKKAAATTLPLTFTLRSLPSANGGLMQDEILLALGGTVSARYARQKPAGSHAPWKVLNGGIGVNVPAPHPDSGLIANVTLDKLDLDAWRASILDILDEDETSKSGTVAPTADDLVIAQYIEPDVLAASAKALLVMGKQLDNVVVGASRQTNSWQANLDSAQISGYVTWEESRSGRSLGRVTARLTSLIVPESQAEAVNELLEDDAAGTQIPALDIVADDFRLFGKRMGKLELLAHNARAVKGREWRIRNLAITNGDAKFRASGKWTVQDKKSLTHLTYALDIANGGGLLERLGFPRTIKGGKGKLDGDLRWNGLPFSLDISSLSGRLHLDMEAGQFLKVEPGVAKLLGVFSLQSLPRRLALDFRDVFSEGFAFDGVNGTGQITKGVLRTSNFKMRSVNAAVLMDGSIDLTKETQDLKVVVIPEINIGAASVVYGLVVNPVVGLGSFLAQLFLREPLMRAFTMEYQITGPWQDPVVRKLDRRPEKSGC